MSADDGNVGAIEAPHAVMPERTLLTDDGGMGQLLWIDGVLPLPVGTRIVLGRPWKDAVVSGVRLVLTEPNTLDLVLDVRFVEDGGAGSGRA